MNEVELRVQISQWLDGHISDETLRDLTKSLKESSEARECYFEYMANHALLCNQLANVNNPELASSGLVQSELVKLAHYSQSLHASLVEPKAKFAFRQLGFFGTAVSLLFLASMLGVVSLLVSISSQSSPPSLGRLEKNSIDNAPELLSKNSLPLLNSIEPGLGECRWYVEASDHETADSISSGDVVRVTHGKLAIEYLNGTKVLLHSPIAFQLISDMKARLIVGRITATVPKQGVGFSVVTPQATIIDLGTEFGAEVHDDGATDVVVFKGEVEVDYHNNLSETRRLGMGEAVRLDAIGTACRILSIDGQTYSDIAFKKAFELPLISEVRDNIERDSSLMYFYEIIHGGMKEDAIAYVDRIAHQYNGIDKEGMPNYLLNADYVKMFNQDRNLQDFQLEITLGRPGNLYVFLDNRVVPPKWLQEDFTDTGDDLGLDRGPFQSHGADWHNLGPSGEGPGISIDDSFSIWIKEVSEPGVVKLGPLGTKPSTGANMFGVAASPIDATP